MRRRDLSPSLPVIALAALVGVFAPHSADAQQAPPGPMSPPYTQTTQSSLGVATGSAAASQALSAANVDPATGVFHDTVAFQLPGARGAVQPQLQLVYSSAGGYGVGGRGWSLAVPSIERHNPSGPPRFDDPAEGQAADPLAEDRFTFGGSPLVEICFVASGGACAPSGAATGLLAGEKVPSFASNGGWHYYRLATESGSMARFFWSPDHTRWVVQYASGSTEEYGVPAGSTDASGTDVDAESHIFRWNRIRAYDAQRTASGTPANLVVYSWSQKKALRWGGHPIGYLSDVYDTPRPGDTAPSPASFAHHAHLAYGWPTGTYPSTTAPVWLQQPTNLLTNVDVTSQDFAATGQRQQVRRYLLSYAGATGAAAPDVLRSVTLQGNCAPAQNNFEDPTTFLLAPPGQGSTCPQSRPPMTFGYTSTAISPEMVRMPTLPGLSATPILFDVNSDGLPDLLDENTPYGGSAGTGTVYVNSATEANTFAPASVSLVSSTSWGPTSVSQLGPGPSVLTGSFQMGGSLSLMWSTVGEWTPAFVRGDHSWPFQPPGQCPTPSVAAWCDPQQSYVLYSAIASSGGWQFVADANGTFPLGTEFPSSYTYQSNGSSCITNPCDLGGEFPVGAIDMNADGVPDLVSTEYFSDSSQSTNGVYYWHQFSIRFSNRGFDGTYDNFAGSATPTVTANPLAPSRTDVCLGGVSQSVQSANSGVDLSPHYKLADVDGDGITDIVIYGDEVQNQLTYWPGHGDDVFGVCPDGSGEECACAVATPETILASVPAPNNLVFGIHDVTGDGLADVVVAQTGGFTVYINQGGETPLFDGGTFVAANAGLGLTSAPPAALYFADMNGSGVDDVIVVGAALGITTTSSLGFVDIYSGGGNPPQSRPELLDSITDGLGGHVEVGYTAVAAASRTATVAGTPWTTASPQPLHVASAVTTSDVNGDSYTTSYVYSNPVFDGRDNQFLGFQSVSQSSPGIQQAETVTDTNYFYAACGVHGVACRPLIDYPLASYRGLPILQDVHDAVPLTSGSTTYFSTTHHSYAADILYQGADQRSVRRVYEKQTDIYLYDTAVFRPAPTMVKILDTDLGEIPAVPFVVHSEAEHIEHQSSVDSFGNISEMDDDGDVSTSPGDAVIKHITTWAVPAATDPANAWVWRPLSTQMGGTATDLASHTTTFAYDAHGNTIDVTKTLAGTAALARATGGAPNPAGASVNGTVHAGHYTYDANGNVLTSEAYPASSSGSTASRCSEVAYDPAYDELMTSQTEDIGACKSPTAMVTQVAYDRVLGLPTTTVDPSGARSATTYDGFGRVASMAKPSATVPGLTDPATTTVSYAVTSYGQQVHVNQAAGATYAASDAYVYEDGLGRTLQVVSTGDTAGTWVRSGQVVRDSRGRVTGRALPAFVAATDGSQVPTAVPTATVGTTYDAFNRVVKTTDIDGTVTSTRVYFALSFVSSDAETGNPASPHAGASVTTSSDGHGRVTSLAKAGNGGSITTTYAYQATGEVLSIGRGGTDQNGTVSYVRSMQYDSLGRLVLNEEPNTGYADVGALPVDGVKTSHWWTYAYDDVGDLVGTSDARGCGENLAYDAAGRIASEDYSPCSTSQNAYTAPSADGDGTEAYYAYEAAQGSLVSGRLADVYDRAAHVHFVRDARGRTTATQKQVAAPGVPAAALASRYAAAEYAASVAYDDRDRVVSQTTGATVAALESANATYVPTYGPSGLGVTYSPRGVPTSVGSSYGPLVTKTMVEADGRPDSVTYGDAAATVARFQYDARLRPAETIIGHTAPYPTATGTYTPPIANSPQPTTPTYLAYDNVVAYDGVNNPLSIADERLSSEWPAGAKPVGMRSYAYDDSYRLIKSSVTFAGSGADTFVPPLAASSASVSPMPLAVPTGTPGRTLTQTFAYDGLGNTVASSDDAELFFDRSLGTITNGKRVGTTAGAPNQLTSAGLASTNGDGNASLTATYDDSGNMVQLAVQRNAGCTSSKGCHELFQYDWDEVGRLARARRYDFVGGTTCSGLTCALNPEPTSYAYPNLPGGAPAADVSYAYDAGGTRVLRASTHDLAAPGLPPVPVPVPVTALASALPPPPPINVTTYTVDIFPSLRLQGTPWTGSTYAESAATEEVYLTLAGTSYGRVVSNPALPAINGAQHVFLELTDTLGSTAAVIDKDTSELVERTTYSPFGGVESDYRPDRWGDFREAFKFTGKEDDVEVGLTYFGARYLSTQLGRWVSPDPLTVHGVSGDLNPYAYVTGRVTTETDALGLDGGCGDMVCLPQVIWPTPSTGWEQATVVPQAPAGPPQWLTNYVNSLPDTPDGPTADLGPVGVWAGDGAVGAFPTPSGPDPGPASSWAGVFANGIPGAPSGSDFIKGLITAGNPALGMTIGFVEDVHTVLDKSKSTGERQIALASGVISLIPDVGPELSESRLAFGDLPYQLHHFATIRNKAFTPAFEKIAAKYGLSLKDAWNTELLPHLGRHPNEYHRFVLRAMEEADAAAGGDIVRFFEEYEARVKSVVRENVGMLRKSWWK